MTAPSTARFVIALATSDAEIARAYPVMHQLRPALASPEALIAQVCRQALGGYRLATLSVEGRVVACAGFRFGESLAEGRYLYVDDLVTDDTVRSQGYGRSLLYWLEAEARRQGCRSLTLDSGNWRTRAHAFYKREGLDQPSAHFRKTLA